MGAAPRWFAPPAPQVKRSTLAGGGFARVEGPCYGRPSAFAPSVRLDAALKHLPPSAVAGLSAAALLVLPQSALAGELTWDGFYRARGEFFDSLSLSNVNPNTEGGAWTIDHRARIQPGWILSERVSLHSQVDLLPYAGFGDSLVTTTDPVTGDTTAQLLSDQVGVPTTEDGGVAAHELRLTRLWGEVRFKWGQVHFGRMPVHWGTGMVFNAGNDPSSEFGDTIDRVLASARVGDVFIMGGYESRLESYVNLPDDYHALVGSVMYNTEKAGLGTYLTYRWRNQDYGRFQTFIADLWGEANFGPAKVEGEFAGIFGGGDLDENTNDVQLRQFGGNLGVQLHPDRLRLGLLTGFATGDGDSTDRNLRTFAFDPDFNISLLMFEEPMPVLQAATANEANGNRTYDAARTGYTLNNALFLRPRVGFMLRDDLSADLSWLLASQAKADAASGDEGRGYGSEIDLDLNWTPFDHFRLRGTGAVLLPGTYYSEYNDADLGGNFNQPAVAGRLMGIVEF